MVKTGWSRIFQKNNQFGEEAQNSSKTVFFFFFFDFYQKSNPFVLLFYPENGA